MFMNVSKTSFVRYGCLKDVFLYVMDVSKMSFERYGCLKDVFCTLWMSQRCLLNVMDVSKMSFERYGCLKDVICSLGKVITSQDKLLSPYYCSLDELICG